MTTQYVYVVQYGNLNKFEVIKETPRGFKVKALTRYGATRERQVFHDRKESRYDHYNDKRYSIQRTFTDSKNAKIELAEQLKAQREYLENKFSKAFGTLENQEKKLKEFNEE